MDIPFGLASYRRDAAQLPEFRLVNMLAEATPAAKTQVAIIGRPGVNSVATWGSGPINGVFREEGVFDGDRFALSGQTLYREGVSIGTVLGDGPCKFAETISPTAGIGPRSSMRALLMPWISPVRRAQRTACSKSSSSGIMSIS